jgi:aminopeptidase-like protein
VCLGDDNPFTYKRSLAGGREVDRVLGRAIGELGAPHQVIDYFPYGYDERQFNSPGFAVPFGSLMRGQHGQFPEYHTSADNLSFVKQRNLEESLALVQRSVGMLNDNRTFRNLRPYGEPQLGKRGVYRALGGTDIADTQLAIFWVLALSDGESSLLDISERSGLPFALVRDAAAILERTELLAAQPA